MKHAGGSNIIFKKIAIIGLGLMGASLGLALKKGGIAGEVAGFARKAGTRKKALSKKIVDAVYDRIEPAVAGADLVVVCAPVGAIPAIIKKCNPALPRNAALTDVGSAKSGIAISAGKIFAGERTRFVGSHPIAGSERHGLEAARPDLYRGAVVAVTPVKRTSRAALQKVVKFWRSLGSSVIIVSPQEHDRIIARTSHLPHLIAALLSACVGRERTPEYGRFCGPGFRDATRIAEGDPRLWRDILADTAPLLAQELKFFSGELRKIIATLHKGNPRAIEKYLNKGRNSRRKLLATRR